jgi:hypothetical protein
MMSATGDFRGLAARACSRRPGPGGFDEFVPAQLAEQLLQVGQRDLLALADRRQGDGTIVLAQCQIDHRGDRKAAFGRETHR